MSAAELGLSSPPADDVRKPPHSEICGVRRRWNGGHCVCASSPPADDVREALAFRLFAHESGQDEEFVRRIWAGHPDEHPVKLLYFGQADALLSDDAFEVRPYGTVTDDGALRSRIKELVANQQSWIDAGQSGQAISRDAMRDVLQKALDETAIPQGAVTEAEVEWEYGVRHVAVDGWPSDLVHVSLEDARADLATCGWNCTLIRRRAAQDAGKWEPVEAARETRS